jgi:hypothetical protein
LERVPGTRFPNAVLSQSGGGEKFLFAQCQKPFTLLGESVGIQFELCSRQASAEKFSIRISRKEHHRDPMLSEEWSEFAISPAPIAIETSGLHISIGGVMF